MYEGAYAQKRKPVRRRRRRTQRPTLLLAALVLIFGALVGSTVAFLFTNTGAVTNTFTPSKVTVDVPEDFDNEVKNNVRVQNTGDIAAYVRAAVVVTWQDDKGNVHPTVPVEGTDYTVTYPANTGWFKHTDGFYYYTSALAPKAETGVLLTACKPVEGKAPAGYHLSVEILASGIQSQPTTAVEDAWPVTVDEHGDLTNGEVSIV